MSIYSNDNIRKITKLTTRELPHLVQKRKNNYVKIMAYYTVVHANIPKNLQFHVDSFTTVCLYFSGTE